MSSSRTHLFWSRIETLWMGAWNSLISAPIPFIYIYIFIRACESSRPLLCLPKVKTPKHHTHRHASTLFGLQSNEYLLWWWYRNGQKDKEKNKRDKNTMSTATTIKESRAPNGSAPTSPFLSTCCTPLRPAFLVAHLRKTSVPPHDVEPCVSFCL